MLISSTLNIKTSNGFVEIIVNNYFQDITISMNGYEDCFSACSNAVLKRKLKERPLSNEDITEIFEWIITVANDEMKYNLLMN